MKITQFNEILNIQIILFSKDYLIIASGPDIQNRVEQPIRSAERDHEVDTNQWDGWVLKVDFAKLEKFL